MPKFKSGVFQGFSPATGWEPWVFTGDEVVLLAEVAPGSAHSFPYGFTYFDGEIYFGATTPETGYEVFRLNDDGEVSLVADLHEGGADAIPDDFTVFDRDLFFTAVTRLPADEDETVESELFRLDGKTGDLGVIDIDGETELDASEFTEFGGDLYFAATTDEAGRELAVISGQTGEASIIDVNAGAASSNPTNLVEFGGDLYFTATTAETGADFFRLDGKTGDVTSLNINEGNFFRATEFVEYRGDLYFSGFTTGDGSDLYRLDGKTGEVSALGVNVGASLVDDLVVLDRSLFFSATTPETGTELFRLDGDEVTVIDVNPGTASSFPAELTVFEGDLYFRANTAATGYELFRVAADGDSAELVFDFGAGDSFATPLEVVDDVLVVTWIDAEGWWLASYDGDDMTQYQNAQIGSFGDTFTGLTTDFI